MEGWRLSPYLTFCLFLVEQPPVTQRVDIFPSLQFVGRRLSLKLQRNPGVLRGLWWQRCACRGSRWFLQTSVRSRSASNRCYYRWGGPGPSPRSAVGFVEIAPKNLFPKDRAPLKQEALLEMSTMPNVSSQLSVILMQLELFCFTWLRLH